MNAVRKPTEDKTPASPEAEKPAKAGISPVSEGDIAHPTASPVHALRARIEAAFRPPSERAMLRITAMVMVLALSSWLAVVMLLSAGS
jgi:hypothetical protein